MLNQLKNNSSNLSTSKNRVLSSLQNQLQKLFLLILVITAGVFGYGGFYFGKNLQNKSGVETSQIKYETTNFLEKTKPEENVLYLGTIPFVAEYKEVNHRKLPGAKVIFLTNSAQRYSANLANDPYTGALVGYQAYTSTLRDRINTLTDFRKVENPAALVSMGDYRVYKIYDTLFHVENDKVFMLFSHYSSTVDTTGDPKLNYSLVEIDSRAKNLREIWTYDIEADPLGLSLDEISPSFGEIYEHKYLTFSLDGDYNSWVGKNAVLNIESGNVKYLPKSTGVQVNTQNETVSYNPVGNLNVKYYSGGGYNDEQVEAIKNATGRTVEEPLP